MNELKTKFGTIYIEDFEFDRHRPAQREEEDRIKIFDSDENYFDYFSTDGLSKEEYVGYFNDIKEMQTIEQLLDYLVVDYEFVGTYDEMFKYLHDELNWENAEDALSLEKRNEYINHIGDYYILICD